MKRAFQVVATHSGTFHCDEALGVAMLRKLPEFASARLIRTRSEEQLATADIVLDVGGVYDAERHRYDHHQIGFTETFGHGFVTKLSSAGCVTRTHARSFAPLLTPAQTDLQALWSLDCRQHVEALANR